MLQELSSCGPLCRFQAETRLDESEQVRMKPWQLLGEGLAF